MTWSAGALLKGDFNGCAYHALQRPTEPEVRELLRCVFSVSMCALLLSRMWSCDT